MIKSLWISVFWVTLCSVLTHAQGSEQDLRRQHKFVVLAPHIVESMYAIGAGEQIIGTTEYSDYPEQANQIPRIGNYARIQVEKVLQMQPDGIIAWRTGNPPDDLAKLKKYGLNLVYSNPEKLTDVAKELRMLGQLTGREAQAEQLATAYLERLESLQQEFADKPKVTVFYELWSRPLRTVAKNAWPQQQVVLCGGENPFADAPEDYPLVSMERVIQYQPQVIVQPSRHSQQAADSVLWSQYSHLPAVANNFIFHPNTDKVLRMTTRMLDEVELLCRDIDRARALYYPE